MIRSSSLFFNHHNHEIFGGEECLLVLQQRQQQQELNNESTAAAQRTRIGRNGLKRKLDSMVEEDDQEQQQQHPVCYCCDDNQEQHHPIITTTTQSTFISSTSQPHPATTTTLSSLLNGSSSNSREHSSEGNLFREVKRVKTSTLTLSHLQSPLITTTDSRMHLEDEDHQLTNTTKEDSTNPLIVYNTVKTSNNNNTTTPTKSPPKTKPNSEKSLSSDVNLMVKEIWRRKLQSSLMSQATGISQFPNPTTRTDNPLYHIPLSGDQFDFDEPAEERAVVPYSIPREELMRRLRTRVDSASNGRQHRFDDPHSTGISDEFYMSDD